MLGRVAVALHGDGGIRVGAAVAVDQQGVALGVVFAAFEMLRDVDLATVGGAPFADGDRLGNDVRSRVIGGVDHLGTRVLVLAGVGEGDGDDFAAGAFALHDDAGVFHRQARTDVAIDPTDFRVFHRDAALGDEVENVRRPVLDGDVLDLRALEGDKLDDCGVQGGGLEFRRGAAFHVHQLGTLVGDDERALELAEVLRVDAEVGLQRLFELQAFWNVDERPAREDCRIQRGEFIVSGGDHLAEPRAENLLVLLQAFGRVAEDDALFGEFFFDVRVGGLRVKLGFDAREEGALLLGNAEALEGFQNIGGHIVPRTLRLFAVG